MQSVKLLLALTKKESLFKIILTLALMGSLPLIDLLLFLKIGFVFGMYLSFAVNCFLSFFGLMFLLNRISIEIDEIKYKQRDGLFPERDFNGILGYLVAAILFLIPGFLSTIFAVFFFIPTIRIETGRFLSGYGEVDWRNLHEFIKLEES